MIKSNDQNQALPLQTNRNLRSRHYKAKAFSIVCGAATSVGIVMLAVLLLDVFSDSIGWVVGRVDSDPRMFAHHYESDPDFKAQADETDPSLSKKFASKLKSKQRSAKRDGREFTPAAEQDVWNDVLHGMYTRDQSSFSQFEMTPTFGQRLSVTRAILGGITSNFASRHPSKAGIKAAIVGSIWLLVLTGLIAVPLGISSAVFLEEYAAKNRFNRFIEVNISNLAGVPSIVYGILGLAIFVRGIGLGRSVIAGAATMSLLILPVIIIASREALKAVPVTLRSSAFALGATRWQVTRHHVLPAALPGIITGVILAMSRALGETAPMIMIGALSFVAFVPEGPLDDFTVLPIQIYNWISMPQHEFHMLGACGIVVLLALLMLMNSVAVFIRYRAQKDLKW